jgi:putative lipoprotein (rSAM/lipoprotein system)
MKKIIKLINGLLAISLGLLGFSGCEISGPDEYGTPHADYTVKGKVTDNVTKKPVKGISFSYSPQVSYLMYGPPPANYDYKSVVSDDKGDYKLTDGLWPLLDDKSANLYITDIDGEKNGLYKDTIVVVNFDEAEKTKKTNGWYEGEFSVSKNIELKKSDE